MIWNSLLAMALAAAPGAPAKLTLHDCNFGEVYAFAAAECHVRLENPGEQAVAVDLSALQQGDMVEPAKLIVPGHGSSEATVRIASGNSLGTTTRFIEVHRRNGLFRDAHLRASGFVMSALDDPKANIAFGDVDPSPEGIHKRIDLGSHETPTFRVLRVLEKPKSIDVGIDPNGRALDIRLRPDAAWGILDGDIKLAIDTPHQKEAWVHVGGNIQGEISAKKNPYWFGSVPAGHDRTVLVPLTDREGREFRIGRITLDNVDGQTDVKPCAPEMSQCKAIRIRISDSQPPGITRGILDIEFPDLNRHLKLRVWGILRPPEAKGARSITAPSNEPAPWTSSLLESIDATVTAVNHPEDIDAGMAPSTLPLPGTGPLLKWVAQAENGAYGYQIFRSDAEGGPFVLISPKTIRVHPMAYASYPYEWRDVSAEAGHIYWYYIGVVYKDGHKGTLSKPRKTIARER